MHSGSGLARGSRRCSASQRLLRARLGFGRAGAWRCSLTPGPSRATERGVGVQAPVGLRVALRRCSASQHLLRARLGFGRGGVAMFPHPRPLSRDGRGELAWKAMVAYAWLPDVVRHRSAYCVRASDGVGWVGALTQGGLSFGVRRRGRACPGFGRCRRRGLSRVRRGPGRGLSRAGRCGSRA